MWRGDNTMAEKNGTGGHERKRPRSAVQPERNHYPGPGDAGRAAYPPAGRAAYPPPRDDRPHYPERVRHDPYLERRDERQYPERREERGGGEQDRWAAWADYYRQRERNGLPVSDADGPGRGGGRGGGGPRFDFRRNNRRDERSAGNEDYGVRRGRGGGRGGGRGEKRSSRGGGRGSGGETTGARPTNPKESQTSKQYKTFLKMYFTIRVALRFMQHLLPENKKAQFVEDSRQWEDTLHTNMKAINKYGTDITVPFCGPEETKQFFDIHQETLVHCVGAITGHPRYAESAKTAEHYEAFAAMFADEDNRHAQRLLTRFMTYAICALEIDGAIKTEQFENIIKVLEIDMDRDQELVPELLNDQETKARNFQKFSVGTVWQKGKRQPPPANPDRY